jgi:hypothetical protein
MKLKIIISIILVVFVVSGLAFLASKSSAPNSHTSTANNNNVNNSDNNSNSTPAGSSGSTNNASLLFSNQPYEPYSYLIYPGTPSSQAQAALSGFTVSTTQLKDGSAMITLVIVSTGGNQTVTLKPGFKLYFVETSFGDDSFGGESSLGDDGYVIVDSNGYVV